ncbi:hypothetical protein KUTeg_001492 [Tegillarca granosa]|uniref:BTB domain-containing protein n=1 Tax=Tegillarca granosa TaxID=220873 RepID=A0ABQ9FVZ6_TEGGR|nr:hypothetical protein KUTeg_001492 [Tegillarca granosa]
MESISTELVVSKENGHYTNGDIGGVHMGLETIEISRTVAKKSFIPLPIKSISSTDDRASTFLQASDTSDMRLVVDGRPLYVSRVVLSLISPVFKEDFDTQSRQKMLKLAVEYKVVTLQQRCEHFLLDQLQKNPKKLAPDKLILYMHLAETYNLEEVKNLSFDVATRTSSDLLENTEGFWNLPHVVTSSLFVQRLKLFEQAGKKINKKLNEAETHCSLYHKNERWGDMLCNKCMAAVGKVAATEITQL